MKRSFQYLLSVLSVLALTFSMTGCKEDAVIKSSLTPAVDNIHTFGIGPEFNNGTDTVTLLTRTAYEDTIITSTRNNGYPIFQSLGWMQDPYAGKTAGGIYMEFVPTAVSTIKPALATSTIDSVVLVLPYAGFTWGDTTVVTPIKVDVYALADSLRLDTNYYNYSSRATIGAKINSAIFATGPPGTGAISDSVTLNQVKYAPHLRITLSTPSNTAYTNAVLAAVAADSTFPAFRSVLKGLAIVPDSNTAPGTALPFFRLNGTADVYGAAALLVYAHDNTTHLDTVFQLPYQEAYAAHFNRVTRNYTPAVNSLLHSTDPHAPVVVMQNAPGAAVDLVIPYTKDFFKNIPDAKNIIINKAELVFTKVESSPGSQSVDDKYFGPARLYAGGMNSTGGRYTIADRYPIQDETLNFIDGTPDTVKSNGLTLIQYRINIPREFQKAIVQGTDGLHLRIGGTINFPAAYRVVLGGIGNPNAAYRPSINIIYSKQ